MEDFAIFENYEIGWAESKIAATIKKSLLANDFNPAAA